MRILFLIDEVPGAGSAGGYQIIYQRILRLARRGHLIGAVCFCQPDPQQESKDLESILTWRRLIPRPRHDRWSVLRRVLRYRRPWWFAAYFSPEFQRAVGDMVEEHRFDVVIAEFTTMGQYLLMNPYLSAVRRVISCHSSPWFGCQRALRIHRLGSYGWLALVCRMARMKQFELAIYRNADWVTTLTPAERYWLLTLAPGLDISVIPAGVDTKHFSVRPVEQTEEALMFMGRFSDETNVDAVLWFADAVWPRIVSRRPETRFYVIGPEPPPPLLALSRSDPRIVVTGYVDDVRPYLARARVFVCPVRIGSGMRTKVLEAMASGVPVVSTALGMEGIPAEPGGNCFIADIPERMAVYIDLLLSDLDLNRALGQEARRTMADKFSWDKITDILESGLYQLLPSGSHPRSEKPRESP